MHFFRTLIIILLLLPVAAAHANTNCGVTLEQVNVSGGGVINIHNSACNGEEAKLNVRYFWVNLDTASLVLSGEKLAELEPIFGAVPTVVKTGVGNEVSSIITEFGVALTYDDEEATNNDDVPGQASLALFSGGEEHRFDFAELTKEQLRKASRTNSVLRYLPLEPFPWYDTHSALPFTENSGWPKGAYTYFHPYGGSAADLRGDLREMLREENGAVRAAETAVSCVQHYRFLKKQEFESYWDFLDEAAAIIEKKEIIPFRFLPEILSVDPAWFNADSEAKNITAGHPSYDAVEYFGRDSWPDDFLLTVGSFYAGNDCAGNGGGFSLTAIPRKPFVLFAVVGSEGKAVTVEGLNFLRDSDESLRASVLPLEEMEMNFASQLRVSEDNPLIIPMRIELRYDLKDLPFANIVNVGEAERVYKTLLRHAPKTLSLRSEPENLEDPTSVTQTYFSRQRKDLPKPSGANITSTYIYGSALELTSVRLGTGTINVASAPTTSLILSRYWDGGSCPFVTFLDEDGNKLLRKRVLIGASAPDKAMTEAVQIPDGATHILIEEIEPEISYLSSITAKGGGKSHSLAKDIALRPQEGLEIALPDGAETVDISGYYELLK